MSDYDDAYGSAWMKAGDLEKGPAIWLVIRRVEKRLFDGEVRPKFILHFDPPHKPLPLNKTNAGTIADVHGKDPTRWPGETVGLYRTRIDFNGKMVDAIRIEMPDEPSHEDEAELNPRTARKAADGLAGMRDDKPWGKGRE